MATAIDYRRQLDDQQTRIKREIADGVFRVDLLRMANAIDPVITLLSQEEVVCKTRRAATSKYQHLVKSIEEQLLNLDQHLIIAILSK